MAQANKITVSLRRSAIGTTPAQRKNLTGLGLIKTGKVVVLNDTSSIRGMIRKVIHLVDVSKGENIPAKFKPKKGYEVILGAGQTATKKTKTAKSAEAKATKKAPAKKTAAKKV